MAGEDAASSDSAAVDALLSRAVPVQQPSDSDAVDALLTRAVPAAPDNSAGASDLRMSFSPNTTGIVAPTQHPAVPDAEALPMANQPREDDWGDTPELQSTFSLAHHAVYGGSPVATAEEFKDIIGRAIPGSKPEIENGSVVYTSPTNKKEYKYTPGEYQSGDTTRALYGVGEFEAGAALPVMTATAAIMAARRLMGRPAAVAAQGAAIPVATGGAAIRSGLGRLAGAVLKNTAGVTAMEEAKNLAGGGFKPENLATGTVLSSLPAIGGAVSDVGSALLGRGGEEAANLPSGAAASSTSPSAPTPVPPSPETQAAATRAAAAVAQADQAVGQTQAAIRGSRAASTAAADLQGAPLPTLQSPALSENAKQILQDIAGSSDKASENEALRGRFQREEVGLTEKAKAIYAPIDKALKTAEVGGPKSLTYLDEIEKGVELPPQIQKVIDHLRPRKVDGDIVNVTYEQFDADRKMIGNMLDSNDPFFKFNNQAKKIAKGLYGWMYEDQKDNIEHLMGPKAAQEFEEAQGHIRARSQFREDAVTLFGRKLAGDPVNALENPIVKLADGAIGGFRRLKNAIPTDMQSGALQRAISTTFGDVFGSEPPDMGKYADWMDRLGRNPPAKEEFMSALEPRVRQQMEDLYSVTKSGINALANEKSAQLARDVALKEANILAAKTAKAASDAAKRSGTLTRWSNRAVTALERQRGKDMAAAAKAIEDAAKEAARQAAEKAKALAEEKAKNSFASRLRSVGSLAGAATGLSHAGIWGGIEGSWGGGYVGRRIGTQLDAIADSAPAQRLMKSFGKPPSEGRQWVEHILSRTIAGAQHTGAQPQEAQ